MSHKFIFLTPVISNWGSLCSYYLYRKSSSAFFLPLSSRLFVLLIYCFFVSEDVVRCVCFYPSHYLRGVHFFLFYGSCLLYRSSSPRMYFSTPVTSNWGWFYSYVFIGIIFVFSAVVVWGVFFYPCHLYLGMFLFILFISLLSQKSSSRMCFATPVPSDWGWFYSYGFYRNHICSMGGRLLGRFFYPRHL